MRIGELARQAGVDVQTVRYYEREVLLDAPALTGSGYRAYGPEHLERLNARRRVTVPASELVVGVQCGGSDAFSGVTANPAVGFCSDLLVRAHLGRVQAKRKALEALESQLSTLASQCAHGHRVADCGILEELIHAAHGEACACHPGGKLTP